jgi:light-regulated signal transduction histidine kinase (bacteriophytochrome)
VRFDEYCLQSALTKLIDNAIKFTDRGEIVLGLNRDSSGTLNLEVRDTGIGIDSDYLPRLFEPFSQEQAGHSRRFEGAGLGLAFARKCVELGGARISAASRKGEGSTFTIAFPRACEIRRRRAYYSCTAPTNGWPLPPLRAALRYRAQGNLRTGELVRRSSSATKARRAAAARG